MIFFDLLRPQGIDFPQFYDASVMFWHRLDLYRYLLHSPGPFNYPPSAFLFLWWPGLLSYPVAGMLWNLLSIGSLFISLYYIHKLAAQKVRLSSYIVTLALFTFPFFPVKHNLASGQINLFVLLFTVLSLYLYKINHKSWSALFLAYATGIKLVPVVFLIVFVVSHDWRQIMRFALWLAILCLIPLSFIPWQFQLNYYTKDFFQAFPLAGKSLYYNQSLLGFLTRSLQNPLAIRLSQYTISLAMVVLTLFEGRKISTNRLVAAATCLYLMLHPLAWQHHFVFIILPLVLLAYDLGHSKAKVRFWVVLIIAYLLTCWNFKQPSIVPEQFNFILSHQFFAALILWILALWREQFFRIAAVLWIGSILCAYCLLILCRANMCL